MELTIQSNKNDFTEKLYKVRSDSSFAISVMKDKELRKLSNVYGMTLAHEAVMKHVTCAIYALTDYDAARISNKKGHTVAHMAIRWATIRENFEKLCSDTRIWELPGPSGVTVKTDLDTLRIADKNVTLAALHKI